MLCSRVTCGDLEVEVTVRGRTHSACCFGQVAIEGTERYLRALEGYYVQNYPDYGYDVTHRH